MADPIEFKSSFEEGGPSPLYQFTQRLDLRGPTTGELLQESRDITERRAGRMEESAQTIKTKAEETKRLATEQAEERKRERPAPYEPPASPNLAARPFLSPPASVLGQLQTALVGIGQLAQGIGGLKGKGYAIGATVALKGALEGWQAGDADRAQRALEQWHVESNRLLAAHRSRREHYQDILEDHTRTMQDRLSEIKLEAEIVGFQELADAARSGEIDRVLAVNEKQRTYELNYGKTLAQVEHYRALEAQAKATADRQAEQLGLARKRDVRAEGTAKQMQAKHDIFLAAAKPLREVQDKYIAVTNQLENYDSVIRAIEVADRAKLFVGGPTAPDQWRAWFARQSAFGDPAVGKAVNLIERQGVALLASADIELGERASQMRLRVVAEPQLAHPLATTRQFWDEVLPRIKRNLERKRTTYDETIRRLAPLFQRSSESTEPSLREVVEQ